MNTIILASQGINFFGMERMCQQYPESVQTMGMASGLISGIWSRIAPGLPSIWPRGLVTGIRSSWIPWFRHFFNFSEKFYCLFNLFKFSVRIERKVIIKNNESKKEIMKELNEKTKGRITKYYSEGKFMPN
jgi:hypothetical protein